MTEPKSVTSGGIAVDLFGKAVADARPRQIPLGLTVVLPGGGTLELSAGPGGDATGDDTAALALRWNLALRRRYAQRHAAKLIARDFGVEVRTAEAWLAARTAPFAKYLLRAWRVHGAGMVAEVLAPASNWHQAASVDAALREVETKLAALDGEITRLRLTKGKTA